MDLVDVAGNRRRGGLLMARRPPRAPAPPPMPRSLLAVAVLLTALPLAAQPVVLDAGFGAGGIAEFSPGTSSRARDAILLPDGGLLLVGEIDDSAGIVKVNADGTLDATFGTAGVFQWGVEGRDSYLSSAVRLDDGRFVATGAVSTESRDALAYSVVLRLEADGTLDTSFGTGGVVEVAQGNGIEDILVAWVEALPDGKVGLLGYGIRTNDDALVVVTVRLLADGARDATYDTDGVVRVIRPVNVTGGFRASDGTLLVAGSDVSVDPDGDAVLLRLRANGRLDTAFGTNGVARPSLSSESDTFFDIAVDDEGRLLAAGFLEEEATDGAEAVVARFTASGALDPSFGNAGLVKSGPAARALGSGVAVRPDGRVLLGGLLEGPPRPLLAQYLETGAPDASFGANGQANVDLGGLSAVTLSLLLDDDGRIYLAGHSRPSGEDTRMLVLRLRESAVATEAGPRAEGLALTYAGAHPATRVRLGVDLDAAAAVRVDLLDPLGRTVARLHDGPLGAGRHTVAEVAGLPSGVYLARAVAADGRAVALPVVVAR